MTIPVHRRKGKVVDGSGVGFLVNAIPDGSWNVDSDHDTKEGAADRVHWLNGGNK